MPPFTAALFRERRSRHVVLVPVLDEGARIRNQLRRMAGVMDSLDVVVVDGGSRDGSTDADALRATDLRALLVKAGPGGLGAQLLVGMAWALSEGYEGVILMDGNDKDDPSDLPRFVEALDAGFDHVQGSRFLPGGAAVDNPWWRVLAIRWLHAPLISLAACFRYTDTTNGFRAYSRRFIEDARVAPFRACLGGYELHYYLSIRAPRLGFRTIEVPVRRVYPRGKVPTRISLVKGNLRVVEALMKSVLGCYNP